MTIEQIPPHEQLEHLDDDATLSDWEIDFIDSLMRWSAAYTTAQLATLQKIYVSHFGD